MSLCRELGGTTYTEFLERISSREICMWRAYNELEKEDAEVAKMKNETKSAVRRR